MGRYGSHVEQTYRNAFGLKKSKSIDWLKLNVSLAKRFFGKQFTQMGRYGSHVEQTYRNAFGLKKSKSIDWLKLNVSLAKRFFGKQGRWAIGMARMLSKPIATHSA